jgi:N-carbamoylputrescine amidase
VKIAGAQVEVTTDVDHNMATLRHALDYAADQGADILLTPEGSLSGYWADFDPAQVAAAADAIVALARDRRVALALGTCFMESDGKRYDELRFYDQSGKLKGFHAKILLCKNVREPLTESELDRFATRPLSVTDFDGVRAGGLVCNDLWANPEATVMDDPHLTQRLASLGAEVIFHAVNSGQSRGEELRLQRAYHDANLRMRSRAAGVWIVTVDAADPTRVGGCRAPSGVLDPTGHWVVKAPERGEGFFSAVIGVGPPEVRPTH